MVRQLLQSQKSATHFRAIWDSEKIQKANWLSLNGKDSAVIRPAHDEYTTSYHHDTRQLTSANG